MDLGLSDNELLQDIAKNQRSIIDKDLSEDELLKEIVKSHKTIIQRLNWIMMTCFALFCFVCYAIGRIAPI